jgi:DNA-binding response OmpR family regulator
MSRQKKRILLVDDDAEIREPVRMALAARGYDVIEAADGFEALVRAERDAPDLIVLDLVMPKRNGFAVLNRLCGTRPKSPRIIMVTANDEPKVREFAQSRGIKAFVPKPFDIDHLIETIEAVLAEKSGD